jgi:SAM-dependent methyltransferase
MQSDASSPDLERWKASLTRTQHHFAAWNAERLDISLDRSYQRYFHSNASVPGGFLGPEFRRLGNQMHEMFSVLTDDSEAEVFESYQFHARMHFLRMLAYPEPKFTSDSPLIAALKGRNPVRIVDFGCGLAQVSRAVAGRLRDDGIGVALTLCDIPTLRKDFLLWMETRTGIATDFRDCTPDRPIPPLPQSDLFVITEVFEHLHDPIPYFDAIEASLSEGAILITDVGDHEDEFFHVSPDLSAIRDRLNGDGFAAIRPNKVYVKR